MLKPNLFKKVFVLSFALAFACMSGIYVLSGTNIKKMQKEKTKPNAYLIRFGFALCQKTKAVEGPGTRTFYQIG